jgi:hypothetical protein
LSPLTFAQGLTYDRRMSKHKANARPAPTLQEQLPELRPGQSVPLLQELHILTREGKLNQDTRRKLKQVYHLVQFIEPLLAEVLAARGDVTLADHGAGKSYLGFILYDLFFKDKPVGRVTGVETRAELVDKSQALANKLGFERMDFLATTVQQALTHPVCPRRSTWSPRCMPATPPPTTRSPSAWPSRPATWCWCRAARPRWPV